MKILNITKLFHLILKLFQNIRYMLIELLFIDRKIGIVVCMLVWKSSLKHVRQIFAVKVARGGGITKQVFSAQQQSNQDEFGRECVSTFKMHPPLVCCVAPLVWKNKYRIGPYPSDRMRMLDKLTHERNFLSASNNARINRTSGSIINIWINSFLIIISFIIIDLNIDNLIDIDNR